MLTDTERQAATEFVYREARLADEARYAEWHALWTGHRYSQEHASAMRRVISNVEVEQAEDGELVVSANFILAELSVQAKHEMHWWVGRTTHRLRRVDGVLKMRHKKVVLVNAADLLPGSALGAARHRRRLHRAQAPARRSQGTLSRGGLLSRRRHGPRRRLRDRRRLPVSPGRCGRASRVGQRALRFSSGMTYLPNISMDDMTLSCGMVSVAIRNCSSSTPAASWMAMPRRQSSGSPAMRTPRSTSVSASIWFHSAEAIWPEPPERSTSGAAATPSPLR